MLSLSLSFLSLSLNTTHYILKLYPDMGFGNLQVHDLVCISDYAYTDTQILVMEKAILEKLEWYLTVPTPYVFLVRYIKASVAPDLEVLYFAFDFTNFIIYVYLSSTD